MTLRQGPRPSGPSGVITLLTDFGLADAYVGVVKGVILAINPRAELVDLSHTVPPQDVQRGARLLEAAWPFFPAGSVHLAVVDPGVGGPRRPIAVEAAGHLFVGPDNGLLGFCFDLPGARGVELRERRYHRRSVSRTFHGRDVFAPVAAHGSLGVPLAAFGPPVDEPVRLAPPQTRRVGRRLEGEVVLVDHFGNLLTNLPGDALGGSGGRGTVRIGRVQIRGLVGTYVERPRRALGALIDSSGRVEVFVREGSAERRLGLGVGARVSWSPPARASTAPTSTRSTRRRSTRHRLSPASGRARSRGRHRSPSSRPPGPSSGPRTDNQ